MQLKQYGYSIVLQKSALTANVFVVCELDWFKQLEEV